LVVTSGIRQSMGLLARLLLEPGEPACVEEPGFAGVRDALEAGRAALIPVPLDAAGFSPEQAEALAPGARLAVVTPAHHYPLGTVMPLPRRLALLAWAERAGGWVAEDDYDGEYRYGGRPLAPLRALDRAGRVAYLGSFSKLLFPALRLSHLVLPAVLVDPAARLLAAGGTAEASSTCTGAVERMHAAKAGRADSYAVRATPVTSAQTWRAWVRAARCWVAETSWRRRWKRLLIPSWAERKRWACPADLKRFICRSRRRVGWCEFSARLFNPLCCRCSTPGMISRFAAL